MEFPIEIVQSSLEEENVEATGSAETATLAAGQLNETLEIQANRWVK